jgi:hypothetical protein
MSDLPELLDHYFSLGVAEGKEGRDHDTETGEAQATRDLIDQMITRLRRELLAANQIVDFVTHMAWREDPPNANNKLTDTERLSAIKFYPSIKALGRAEETKP